MQALQIPGFALADQARARFRPPPAALLAYLGGLLALELLSEAWLGASAPPVRAVLRWALLVLALAPVSGLVAWRSCQADRALAVGQRRDVIRHLVQELAAEDDAGVIPMLMVRQVRELTGARLVFLAQPDGDGFRVEAVSGDDGHSLAGQTLPIHASSPGLAGESIRRAQPLFLAETWNEDGLAARRELALSDRVHSAAVLPLIARGQVLGLIGLHANVAGFFGPRHSELLTLYAEQAMGAFENAQLAMSVHRLDAAHGLDQAKSEFLSAVAHELRAPLGPLMGWAELLLTRDYDPQQARPMLESIHESAQHLSVLVGDLLDLARGEAGHLDLELTDFDLGETIEGLITRWREADERHHFVVAVSGPLPVRADSHRVRQVLDNLLSNASKYSPADSRIFIAARPGPGGQALVRITDQGIGLAPEDRDQLFTKFFRTASAREMAAGTGLGLSLCKLIIEAHGGAVQVESEGPGHGIAVTFSLPARAAARPHATRLDLAGARA